MALPRVFLPTTYRRRRLMHTTTGSNSVDKELCCVRCWSCLRTTYKHKVCTTAVLQLSSTAFQSPGTWLLCWLTVSYLALPCLTLSSGVLWEAALPPTVLSRQRLNKYLDCFFLYCQVLTAGRRMNRLYDRCPRGQQSMWRSAEDSQVYRCEYRLQVCRPINIWSSGPPAIAGHNALKCWCVNCWQTDTMYVYIILNEHVVVSLIKIKYQ